MKQTAVEWFNQQLNLYGDMAFNKEITLGQYHIKKQELLEQAKEMEAEQKKEAYNQGIKQGIKFAVNEEWGEEEGGAK
jgi:hypothetical protein